MKILFFIESLRPGGKERRLVELIKGLTKETDFEIELVLTKKEIHYADIFDTNIKIHYCLRKRLKKDPRVFYSFYKIAKSSRPDFIHVWGNLVAIYAIPAKILLKIPLFNNQISDAPEKVKLSILSQKLSFPFSDLIIANSHAGIVAYNAPEEKSMVIYNGFDFSRIDQLDPKEEVRERFKIKTKLVVGMVASFSDKKDYKSYIEAAEIILNKYDDVTFLCIGDGEDEVYKKMIAIENSDKILFLGKQSKVENIMNICDVGVLSTYTEGISNSLLEFAALGKPTVSNFGGGTIEIIENETTGFLVDQKSPKALAKKIFQLIDNKKLRIELGLKAKQHVTEKFSIKQMLSEFINTYKSFDKKKK